MPFILNPYMLAVAGGGGAGFLTVTIAHGMFPSTQTDIEIWFSFTNSDLKTVANGGHVVNSNHRRFASDSAGTSLYKYDIVTPDATTDSTGLIEGWVLVPSGSSSVDTVLYIAYNDNGVTTYQGDRSGMWARKAFANHGSDGTSSVFTNDYGTSGLTLSLGNTPTAVAGKLSPGAVHFVAASSQFLNRSTGTVPDATNTFTISAWVKLATNGIYQAVLGNGKATVGGQMNNYILAVTDTNKAYCNLTQGDSNYKSAVGATSLSTGVWYWLVGRYDNSNLKIFLNGAEDGSLSLSGNSDSGAGIDFGIGRYGANNAFFANSDIGEPRVDVVHADSADRILAQYRNQNSPATYITVT